MGHGGCGRVAGEPAGDCRGIPFQGESGHERDKEHDDADERLQDRPPESPLGRADADLDGVVDLFPDPQQLDGHYAEEGADDGAYELGHARDGNDAQEDGPEQPAYDTPDHAALAATGLLRPRAAGEEFHEFGDQRQHEQRYQPGPPEIPPVRQPRVA